jgi:predicted N-formylglutamate amidohydrolase
VSERHDEVVEVLEGDDHAGVLLTCEHASNVVPPPWAWPPDDRWLIDTHWAIDLGIGDVTRDLARAIGAPAVLARFSRLLCDANRPLDAPTLFREVADGRTVQLNQDLTEHERHERISRLHQPYHEVADGLLRRYPRAVVLSMHSFTPIYEDGPPRPMQIGVLFDREEQISVAIGESLARQGYVVALNEPYSGKDGLIYSAERHATRHGRRALELEIRQDLALDVNARPALVHSLRNALVHAGVLTGG